MKKNRPEIDSRIDFIEIDFTQVVKKKSTLIKNKTPLTELVNLRETQSATLGPHDIHTDAYKLLESDVRDGPIIVEKLRAMGVNPDLPTLVLTECLLIYMRSEDTQ